MTKMLKLPIVLIGIAIGTGCTSTRIQPLTAKPSEVCIRQNSAVQVDDFISVVQKGFLRHGIATTVYAQPPRSCAYVLDYTARRSWDVVPYLSVAELTIRDAGGRVAGSAHYHLRGKGGLSLTKWQGTETKMAPVIDGLLGNMLVDLEYTFPPPTRSETASRPAAAAQTNPAKSKKQQIQELQQLNLPYQEYMERFNEIETGP